MKKRIGSGFDGWLEEGALDEEVTGAATKRLLAPQIAEEMSEQSITTTEMASRIHTNRSAIDRLLDPEQEAVTPDPTEGCSGRFGTVRTGEDGVGFVKPRDVQ